MTVQRLDDKPVSVGQFCACVEETQGMRVFLAHIGLAGEPKDDVRYGDTMKWAHVRPPFSLMDDVAVHVIGWINLSEEERKTIGLFIRRHEAEVQRAIPINQYIVFPCRQEPSDKQSYRRFSCAGFVLEAYQTIGITLLDESVVPEQELTFLKKHYPFLENCGIHTQNHVGLVEPGPWRVVLPGYVLNAFNRTDNEIRLHPYQPTAEDCFL